MRVPLGASAPSFGNHVVVPLFFEEADFLGHLIEQRQPRSELQLAREDLVDVLLPVPVLELSAIQQHPRQEQLFFTLLRECLERGSITERFLRTAIRKKYLRSDAFALLDRLPDLASGDCEP